MNGLIVMENGKIISKQVGKPLEFKNEKKLIIFFIFIPNILFAGSMKAIGVKGQEENIDRVIKVSMYDNYYEPNKFEIKKDETIKFIVKNKGQLVHEFNIATKEMHLKHQPEMMMMVEHEILLVDKIDKNERDV